MAGEYGNRHRYDYDKIIVESLKEGQEHFDKNSPELGKVLGSYTRYSYSDKPIVNLNLCFSKLFRVVKRRGNPGVSRKTIQRHLNRLVERGILERSSMTKVGNTYQRPYCLAPARTTTVSGTIRVSQGHMHINSPDPPGLALSLSPSP